MADPAGPLDRLLPRCTFPDPGSAVTCAFSGGADSTALIALADAAGCRVTAIHVDHRLRPSSGTEAGRAEALAATIGVDFRVVRSMSKRGPISRHAPGTRGSPRCRRAR